MNKRILALLAVCFAAAIFNFNASIVKAADTTPSSVEKDTASNPTPVVAPNYKIQEEDVLRLDVWGEQELSNMQFQVTPDGKINVPYIGEIVAAGLTQADLTSQISEKLKKMEILVDPKVQITIMTLHQPQVRVWGEVNRPGAVVFKDGDTVMDAIAQAGSYTQNAMLESATITRRDDPDKPIALDLKKIVNGDLTQNYTLKKGDTIYVPPSDYNNKFYVLGEVMRPGIYDLKDNATVLSAITLAGGPTEKGALKATKLLRGDFNNPESVPLNLSKLFDKADLTQNVTLKSGDVVIVPGSKKPDWNKISQVLSTIVNLTYIRRYGLF